MSSQYRIQRQSLKSKPVKLASISAGVLRKPARTASFSRVARPDALFSNLKSGLKSIIRGVTYRSVVVHFRFALAACGRQMAEVDNDRPDFVIAQNSFGARHARRPDTVVDHRLQLPIGVVLH